MFGSFTGQNNCRRPVRIIVALYPEIKRRIRVETNLHGDIPIFLHTIAGLEFAIELAIDELQELPK